MTSLILCCSYSLYFLLTAYYSLSWTLLAHGFSCLPVKRPSPPPRAQIGAKGSKPRDSPTSPVLGNPAKCCSFVISNRREVLAKNASGSDLKNLTIASRGQIVFQHRCLDKGRFVLCTGYRAQGASCAILMSYCVAYWSTFFLSCYSVASQGQRTWMEMIG